jgi:hypothetical protein
MLEKDPLWLCFDFSGTFNEIPLEDRIPTLINAKKKCIESGFPQAKFMLISMGESFQSLEIDHSWFANSILDAAVSDNSFVYNSENPDGSISQGIRAIGPQTDVTIILKANADNVVLIDNDPPHADNDGKLRQNMKPFRLGVLNETPLDDGQGDFFKSLFDYFTKRRFVHFQLDEKISPAETFLTTVDQAIQKFIELGHIPLATENKVVKAGIFPANPDHDITPPDDRPQRVQSLQ